MLRRPALFLGVLRVLCGWFPASIKKTAEDAEDAEDCSSFLECDARSVRTRRFGCFESPQEPKRRVRTDRAALQICSSLGLKSLSCANTTLGHYPGWRFLRWRAHTGY